MASSEFILSENEWQSFLLFKEYAKQLFGVDISRKDDFYGVESCAGVEGPLFSVHLPPTQQHGDSSAPNTGHDEICLQKSSVSEDNVRDEDCILRPPPVIVHIEAKSTTKSSRVNLEMCRKFAIACSPSNPDYRIITIHLDNQHSLEMVKASSTNIQQSTAALITFYPDQSDITIQGHHNCVELAKQRVDMILPGVTSRSKSVKQLGQIQSDKVNVNHFQPSLSDNRRDVSQICDQRSNIDAQNHHGFLSERRSPLNVGNFMTNPIHSDYKNAIISTDSGIHNNQMYGNVYNFSALSNIVCKENEGISFPADCGSNLPFQLYKVADQSNTHSDYEISSESEEDNILADERFKKRIDQATKCGYSDGQVTKVLKRLGVDSSMDDMMRELLKEPQDVSAYDNMEQTETNVLKGEDSDDSEGFDVDDSSNLRHIIIDGSNVAMSHGQKVFSCLGIKIVVDWFKSRGHTNITAFVPQWRKEASRPDAPITNQEILTELESEKIVVFTPSRRIGSTRIVCYDDRYVLNLAAQTKGIVVSNDIYRDLVRERDDFRQVVAERLLMYSFVQDTFMPPEDPLGRQGPSLDNFLRIKPSEPKKKPQNCPYGKKCTYGNKCRYYHPERRYAPQKMVAEKLKENAELKHKAAKAVESFKEKGRRPKQKLSRTISMLPQESFDKTSDDIFKKPQLHHSQSLVYPSSYLSDLRMKMEEAELAEEYGKPAHFTLNMGQDLNPHPFNNTATEPSSKQYSNSCDPSSPNSQPFKPESIKTKVKAVQSFPLSPVPNPSSPTRVTVQSSLNIPNSDSQDRYLSGHLLVVKKLSDEDNTSGNFFSQHTSRAPGSPHQQDDNNIVLDNRLLSSDSNTSPVSVSPQQQIKQDQKDAHDSNLWNGREIYLAPDLPTQVDYKTSVKDKRQSSVTHFFPLNENHASATDTSICPSSTFSRIDKGYELTQLQNFRRSPSSTFPQHSSEHNSIKPVSNPHKKHSLDILNTKPMENCHTLIKPHHSVPLPQHAPHVHNLTTNSPPFHPVSWHHRATTSSSFQPQRHVNRIYSDSGISSGGLSSDHHSQSSPLLFSPTDNLSSPFSSISNSHVFSPTTQNPVQFIWHHQELMYQSSPSPLNQSPSNHGDFPLPSPWQLSPFSNQNPFDTPPPFQDLQNPVSPTKASNTQSSQFYNLQINPAPTLQYLNPSPFQQQSMYPPGMVNVESPYNTMYIHSSNRVPNNMSYGPNIPSSPLLQQPPIKHHTKVIDEEAPINVDDDRFSIYHNLSSLFGERIVRTFMNRNPDVRNFKELHSLISSYKQEKGM